jgi:hypothetical protein
MSKSLFLQKVEEEVKRLRGLGMTDDQIVKYIIVNHTTFVESLVKYAINNINYCGVP